MARPDGGQRFRCTVPGCDQRMDYSLVTLFEHQAYHLYQAGGYTDHFEYKCNTCNGCFFTSRIFMTHHALQFPQHDISRTEQVDLENVTSNKNLKHCVVKLTNELLRTQFEPIGMGGSGRRFNDRSPSNDFYKPGTPRRSLSRASSRASSRAGSPMSTRGGLDAMEQMELDRMRMDVLFSSMANSAMDDRWKEMALRFAFASNNTPNGDQNGGLQQGFQGRGFMNNANRGDFDGRRGLSPNRDMSPPGGRFGGDNRGRGGFRGGDGDGGFRGGRGGGFRGRGDFHGDGDRGGGFRGRSDGDFRGGFRGDRGGFRGRGDSGGDRGSFRGGRGGRSDFDRGREGFGVRSARRSRSGSQSPKARSPVRADRDRSFSRSKSPQGHSQKKDRSWSRSRSRSASPQKNNDRKRLSPKPHDDTPKKKVREDRSYSRSP